jgi:DNA-binding GntR family transcriptional regulator
MVKPPDVVFETTTLAEQVYHHLLERISTGVYVSGQRLPERELVASLGVSRTPIREALLRLSEYGLVDFEGRVAMVRRLSLGDVRNLYQVRRVLELEAVRLACGRITADDFAGWAAADPVDVASNDSTEYAAQCHRLDALIHRTIAERAGNSLLAHKLRKLHHRVLLVCRPSPGRLNELRAIMAAFRANDRRDARRAMLVHLKAAYRIQRQTAKSSRPSAAYAA